MRCIAILAALLLAGCAQPKAAPAPGGGDVSSVPTVQETFETTSEAFVSAGTGDLDVTRREVRLLEERPPNLTGVIVEVDTVAPTTDPTSVRIEAWSEGELVAEPTREGPSTYVMLVEPAVYTHGVLALLIAPSTEGPSAQAVPEFRIQTTVFQYGPPDWEFRAP